MTNYKFSFPQDMSEPEATASVMEALNTDAVAVDWFKPGTMVVTVFDNWIEPMVIEPVLGIERLS